MTNSNSMDRKVLLSTLWIFAVLNYIYADVFTLFFDPAAHTGTAAITAGAALVFAVLMETSIAMVVLSRVLKRGANRWANIAAGIFHTGFVTWSLFGQPPKPFYLVFVVVEIACTLLIVVYAWTWKREAAPASLA
jgi:hypothetical protein